MVCCPHLYPLRQRPSFLQLLGVLAVDSPQLSRSPGISHCWREPSHARVLSLLRDISSDWLMYILQLYLLRAQLNKFHVCQSLSQSLFPEIPTLAYLYISTYPGRLELKPNQTKWTNRKQYLCPPKRTFNTKGVSKYFYFPRGRNLGKGLLSGGH